MSEARVPLAPSAARPSTRRIWGLLATAAAYRRGPPKGRSPSLFSHESARSGSGGALPRSAGRCCPRLRATTHGCNSSRTATAAGPFSRASTAGEPAPPSGTHGCRGRTATAAGPFSRSSTAGEPAPPSGRHGAGAAATCLECASIAASGVVSGAARGGPGGATGGARDDPLQSRQGTLGLERDYGSGNVAMARAMEVMVERFCTVRVCRPGCHEDAEGVQPRDAARVNADPDSLAVRDEGGAGNLVEALFCHLKEITHMLVADAAPDGHLAYENLQKKWLPAQRLGSPLRPGARREAAGHAAVESGRGNPRSFRDPDSRQALLNDDSPELARAAEVAAIQFGEVRHHGDNSPRSRYGHPKTQVPGKSRYHKYVKATNVFWFPVDK